MPRCTRTALKKISGGASAKRDKEGPAIDAALAASGMIKGAAAR